MALGAIFSFASWIYVSLLIICTSSTSIFLFPFSSCFFLLVCSFSLFIPFPHSNFPPSLTHTLSLLSPPPPTTTTTTTTTTGSAAYTHTCWMDPAASLQGMKYSQSSESKKHGLQGIVFKLARVGERLSGVICLSLICMAVHTIIA